MVVGVARVRLRIPDSRSLKDKRRVVQSLKSRIHNEFNVSIAEVDALENRQLAVLGVAQVCNDGRYVNGTFEQIMNLIRRCPFAQVVDYEFESY